MQKTHTKNRPSWASQYQSEVGRTRIERGLGGPDLNGLDGPVLSQTRGQDSHERSTRCSRPTGNEKTPGFGGDMPAQSSKNGKKARCPSSFLIKRDTAFECAQKNEKRGPVPSSSFLIKRDTVFECAKNKKKGGSVLFIIVDEA